MGLVSFHFLYIITIISALILLTMGATTPPPAEIDCDTTGNNQCIKPFSSTTTEEQQTNGDKNKLTPGPLLDNNGALIQAGWATSLVKDYKRELAADIWLKEWDYYYTGNSDVGFAFTIADNSYLGLISISFLNYTSQTYITQSKVLPFTFGSLKLPSTPAGGDILYDDGEFILNITHKPDNMIQIDAKWPKFFDGKNDVNNPLASTLLAKLTLSQLPRDTMVIVSPFESAPSKTFYYNQKINCMKTGGLITFADQQGSIQRQIDISKQEKPLLTVLDWGRGRWTYSNTWYWSSLSSYLPDGSTFGFNLGYGFSIRQGFTENMVFYNGIASKLDQAHFYIPVDQDGNEDFMATWNISDDRGRLALSFVPTLDRFDDVNVVIIRSWQHQVFGKFYGKVTLDDGKIITLNGENVGFAEKVANRW